MWILPSIVVETATEELGFFTEFHQLGLDEQIINEETELSVWANDPNMTTGMSSVLTLVPINSSPIEEDLQEHDLDGIGMWFTAAINYRPSVKGPVLPQILDGICDLVSTMLGWMRFTSDTTAPKVSLTKSQIIGTINSKIIGWWPALIVYQEKVQQQWYSLTNHISFWHGIFEAMLRNLIGEWSHKAKSTYVSQ